MHIPEIPRYCFIIIIINNYNKDVVCTRIELSLHCLNGTAPRGGLSPIKMINHLIRLLTENEFVK